jgi:hypothetical protein
MTQRNGRGRAAATLRMIDAMVAIAAEIQPCGVRALAYQLFVRKLIPSMETKHTQKVSTLSVIAREEGTLPWEWIVDPTRQEEVVPTWSNPEAYAQAVMNSYRRNKWADQPTHVEVWSEKATIAGTLRPILDQYEVPFQILHGWSGATPLWNAAQANLERHQSSLILYIGDYDPSGMWMSEMDLPARLARYSSNSPAEKDWTQEEVQRVLWEADLKIRRIALTREDTQALGRKLGFPAKDKAGDEKKKGDSRYQWFTRNYGDWCWELDALSPVTLRERVEQAIVAELDQELWDRYVHVEQLEAAMITETCAKWMSICGQDQK